MSSSATSLDCKMGVVFPICGTCKEPYVTQCIPCNTKRVNDRLDNTVNRQNGCKSCGGYWKDCPICEKNAIKLDSLPQTQLYLFRVTIHPATVNLKVARPPTEEVVILDLNEDSASDNALIATGYANPRRRIRVEVDLIEGPFTAGEILAHKIRNV